MKLLLKTFCIFFLVGNAFSQEYHPLLKNSSWIIYDQMSCCQPSVEKTIGKGTDEIIGSVTYKKFIDPFSGIYYGIESTVYLREDSIEKKVYK